MEKFLKAIAELVRRSAAIRNSVNEQLAHLPSNEQKFVKDFLAFYVRIMPLSDAKNAESCSEVMAMITVMCSESCGCNNDRTLELIDFSREIIEKQSKNIDAIEKNLKIDQLRMDLGISQTLMRRYIEMAELELRVMGGNDGDAQQRSQITLQ